MVPYGGFWWRVLAYFLDAIILNIASSFIGGVLGLGVGMAMFGIDADVVTGAAVASSVAISFVVSWLYFAGLECSRLQGTLGKLAVGLVVTDLRGERISFLRATGRYFAKILSGMILLIGFIMVAFTERKQGLHDLLAGTLVYRTRDPSSVYDSSDVFA
ncbi:RDD family protein [Novosphingobium soli]|uniref:RDD family protein n=1 Tax=Novosphingobium soli TaxID=574956 RepID=A0ABV6CZT1_9SPHN